MRTFRQAHQTLILSVMTTIWRLNIKTDAEEGVDPRAFCIDRNILGIGWQVADSPLNRDAYYALGLREYYENGDKGWWPAVNAILYKMNMYDLCWTRDRHGNYYIGRIEGGWEYRSTIDYRDADVVNVRPCRWFQTGGLDSVPGKVLNSFRARRAVQAVHSDTSSFYSKLKYNQLSKEDAYRLPSDVKPDLFDLISPEDCEDIVGIYLQEKHGYRLIPSSCRLDTFKTEFVLKTTDGKQAYAQVKQGNVDLDMDEFKHDPSNPCEWYLFTTNGRYTGTRHAHLHCIKPDDMRGFALANPELMSNRVQTFIDFCVPAV